MQNFLSYHFALKSRLLQRPTLCHTKYLRRRIAFPLMLPPDKEFSRAEVKFQTLKTLEPVPPMLKRPITPSGCHQLQFG